MPMRVIGAGWDIKRDNGAAFLVQDTFTDANGTLLAAHTPEAGGPWVLVGNEQFKVNNNTAIKTGNTDYPDNQIGAAANVDVQASITFIGPGSINLAYRCSGSGHPWIGATGGLQLELYGGLNFRLWGFVSGAWQLLVTGTTTIQPDTTYTPRMVASGNTSTGYLNGVQELTWTGADWNTNTYVGLTENKDHSGSTGTDYVDNFEAVAA